MAAVYLPFVKIVSGNKLQFGGLDSWFDPHAHLSEVAFG